MKALIISLCLLAGAPFSEAPLPATTPSAVSAVKKPRKQLATVTFRTTMHCKSCVKKITENLSFEKGVEDLKVSLDEKRVTILYDPAKTDEKALAEAIRKLGYEAEKE